MPASDYLDRAVLRWAFESLGFPVPPTVHLALFNVAPSKGGGGTEVSGLGYARLPTVLADWAVSGPPYRVDNARVLNHGSPLGSWGTLVAWGCFDAASSGNLLWFASLSQQRTPAVAQPVVWNLGALTIAGV